METIYNIGLSRLSLYLKKHYEQITEDEALSLKRKPKGKRLVIQCYRKNGTVSSTHLHTSKETPEEFIEGTIPYIDIEGSYEFFLVAVRFTEMKKLSEANSNELKMAFLEKNAELIEELSPGASIPGKKIIRVQRDRQNSYRYSISIEVKMFEKEPEKGFSNGYYDYICYALSDNLIGLEN